MPLSGSVAVMGLIAGLAPVVLEAQSPERLSGKEAISIAHSAPAEFGADFLLRLLEEGLVQNREEKLQLLTQATSIAWGASEKLPYRAVPGGPVDSRAGYLSTVYRHRLDQLSIRCRILRQLVQLDKKRAGQMLADLAVPDLAPIECTSGLAYDFRSVYQDINSAAALLSDREEVRADILVPWLTVKTPEQIEPAVRMLLSTTQDLDRFQQFLSTFSYSLASLPSAPRSAAYTIAGDQHAIRECLKQCVQRNVATSLVLNAFRQYLTRQMTGVRCADRSVDWSDQVKFFNDSLLPLDSTHEIAALSLATGSRFTDASKIEPYWQNGTAKSVLMSIKKLRFGSGTVEVSSAEQDSAEWREQYRNALSQIEEWSQNQQQSADGDFFAQKSIAYVDMVFLAPDRELELSVVKRCLHYIATHGQVTPRLLWFMPIQRLLNEIKHGPLSRSTALLDAMLVSEHPVIYMYARLYSLQRRPLGQLKDR